MVPFPPTQGRAESSSPTPELGRKTKQGITCSNAHAGAWSKDQAGHHHPRRSLVARPSRASVNVTVCLRLVERPSWAVAILTHAEYPPAWPTCVPPQGECVKRTTQFTTLIHPTADHVLALAQATACHSLVVSNHVSLHGVPEKFPTQPTTLTQPTACHSAVVSECVSLHEVIVNFLTRPIT